MLFAQLHSTLLASLRARVRNGTLTERQLARLVGVSQPHIHNVLKGARSLSPEFADEILSKLNVSVLDLIDRTTMSEYLSRPHHESPPYAYVPVIPGQIGPGHPWPVSVGRPERLPVSADRVALMTNPAVARLAHDDSMHSLFTAGDLVIFDQNISKRRELIPSLLYLVKLHGCGLIRRVRLGDNCLHISSAGPFGERQVELGGMAIEHIVRARATLLGGEGILAPHFECAASL